MPIWHLQALRRREKVKICFVSIGLIGTNFMAAGPLARALVPIVFISMLLISALLVEMLLFRESLYYILLSLIFVLIS